MSKAVIFALSLLSSLVFFNQTSLTRSPYLQVPSAMMVSMSSWEISVMARDVPVLSKELKSPRLILLKLGMAKMGNYLLKKSMICLMLSLMILTRMNCDCENQNCFKIDNRPMKKILQKTIHFLFCVILFAV